MIAINFLICLLSNYIEILVKHVTRILHHLLERDGAFNGRAEQNDAPNRRAKFGHLQQGLCHESDTEDGRRSNGVQLSSNFI